MSQESPQLEVTALQEKGAAEGREEFSPASQHKDVSFEEAGSSPGHASHLAQPSKSMALSDAAVTAGMSAELDSLAAASPGGASASGGVAHMPAAPLASSSQTPGTGEGQLDPMMMSMSSDSLSALPTPTHPSAAAAAAQELNNALARSLLQPPHLTEEAAAASPHSERLTSAYSGIHASA